MFKTTIPIKPRSVCDTQADQSQALKSSGYRSGRGLRAQEWMRSAGKRFNSRFQM